MELADEFCVPYLIFNATIWHKFLTRENIDKSDEFLMIHQNFLYQMHMYGTSHRFFNNLFFKVFSMPIHQYL